MYRPMSVCSHNSWNGRRGQRLASSNPDDPVYLRFLDTETMNVWIALLRSYAMPELYGRPFSSEGGLYRMWREVNLTIAQGRNLGVSLYTPGASKAGAGAGPPPEAGPESPPPDTVDMDVFCEIYLNDTLAGRTTVKKAVGVPEYHEKFSFPDLPPFDNLTIVVLRERRSSKPVEIGAVSVVLSNFRRGEQVEGWWPLLRGEPGSTNAQVGELRLKLQVDESVPPWSVTFFKLTSFQGDCTSSECLWRAARGMLVVTNSICTILMPLSSTLIHVTSWTGWPTWRLVIS
jgi:hypothetical protein